MREEEDRRKEGGEKREKRRDGRKEFFRIPHTQNEDLKNVNF